MKQPIPFICFLALCVASVCAQSDSVTFANVHGMAADSISANGTVPTMGWDTTATSRIVVTKPPHAVSRCMVSDWVNHTDTQSKTIVKSL